MKVQVVHDFQGRIISISKPGDLGHAVSGIGNAGIVPEPNQTVQTIDLPQELVGKDLLEIHNTFRLDTTGGAVKLVHAKDFKGPFQPQ
jgi:hypothetical protein